METSYSNKPYFFAPLVDRVERREPLNRQLLLTGDTYVGKLRVTIECVTPVHFGSGQLTFDEKTRRFSYALLKENGRIALPGSSIKGMLRSVFEAVTASCVLNAPRALPQQVGKLSACRKSSDLRPACSDLCPACSVFGCLSYKGKLTFSAFYTEAEPISLNIPTLEQPFRTYPRPGRGERDLRTGNERLYYGGFRDIRGLDVARMSKSEFLKRKDKEPKSGGNYYGRKFYKHSGNWKTLTARTNKDSYECLPIGTSLDGNIVYQGLSEDELGALFFTLGLGWPQPIFHKLGYAKPAYLGSVKLNVAQEALPRYENAPMTAKDAEEMALQHYEKHKPIIEAAVHELSQEWSEIGDSMWPMQDGRYGY